VGLTSIDGSTGCIPPELMTFPTQSLGQWGTETLSGGELPPEAPAMPSSASASPHPSAGSADTSVFVVIDSQPLVFGLVSVISYVKKCNIPQSTLCGSPEIQYFGGIFAISLGGYNHFSFYSKNERLITLFLIAPNLNFGAAIILILSF